MTTRGLEEGALIVKLFTSFDELRKMGWQEVAYAPVDMVIELIEPGSTGIHQGYRDELGRFWVVDERDTYPSHPVLFRRLLN